jgi:hypothetical protein
MNKRPSRPFRFRPLVQVLEDRNLLSFLPPVSYPVGPSPLAVVTADLNGDGVPDLITANGSAGTVSVLLGNGGGTFAAAQDYAAGPNVGSVAVGDFNGDGIPDLVVTNGSAGTVSVLLGNGDGSFQAPQSYAAGSRPAAVAVGDFNGDGIPDLAVADNGRTSVNVLLGNGDGSFQQPIIYGAGVSPAAVAVGDFNGDGNQDIAVANNFYAGSVNIFLGNGDGTFARAPSIDDGHAWHNAVAVGDFNGDGIPDLAVTDSTGTTVGVFLGNGDGTFQHARTFAVGFRPWSVAVGDFNGDGNQDLAVANLGSDTVSVLLGNGDGSFQGAQSYAAGPSPVSVAVGDFNGDGFPDLAVANDNNADTVSVLLNAADWGGGSPGTQSQLRQSAMHHPAPSPALLDPLSARHTVNDSEALTQPSGMATDFQPQFASRPPVTMEGGQSGVPKAASNPRPLATAPHARDAAFQGWGDTLGDLLPISLLWPGR